MEIGIQQGESFELAKTAKWAIGVDPRPRLRYELWPGAKVFSMTSDAFFASYDLQKELGGNPVELAFIDGRHLFEYALRDFINLEKHGGRSSTILVAVVRSREAVTASIG